MLMGQDVEMAIDIQSAISTGTNNVEFIYEVPHTYLL
jgi:hypothetical protein